MMRHLDLFSGIGGFALAASRIWGEEHEIVSFCDNDPAAQVVLKHHWPEVLIHGDIKTLDATKWRGTIDLVTGGFPCQPFSCAGKRRGTADDRYLWPEMLRVIAECQPRWVLGENVAGIVNMELDTVLADLEKLGYETIPVGIYSCAIDAPIEGLRIYILASSHSIGLYGFLQDYDETKGTWRNSSKWSKNWYVSKMGQTSIAISKKWEDRPPPLGMVDGISNWIHRLRLLGNSIVPQVAEEIFRCMKMIDEKETE